MNKTLKIAAKLTLPVFFGYLFLGMGFGLQIEALGYNFLWATLSAVVIYAGSMQYVMVSFLRDGLNLISCAVTTLTVNSRHVFYGISFLEKFNKMGKKKWYMIFSLTDETYSLLSTLKTPEGIKEENLMFIISVLNHSYWIVGCTLGAVVGQVFKLNITGVEFSMTALFVVIFLDQWKTYDSHIPAFVGSGCGVLFFVILGPKDFLLPTLIASVIMLVSFRKQIEPKIVREGD